MPMLTVCAMNETQTVHPDSSNFGSIVKNGNFSNYFYSQDVETLAQAEDGNTIFKSLRMSTIKP